MKELNELRIPFAWPDRKPILLDKCLYLPRGFVRAPSFHWKDPNIFEKEQPLIVEYCSGNGQWIAALALKNSHCNWIAVEQDFYRARKIWLKIFRQNIKNLFVVCGEAQEFTRFYLSDQSVNEAYVNFPDPWPKRRHAKHRLVQPSFVDELARVIQRSGSITLVTDDANMSEQMIVAFASWRSAFPPFGYTTEEAISSLNETSYFHALWKKQGRLIRTHRFYHG